MPKRKYIYRNWSKDHFLFIISFRFIIGLGWIVHTINENLSDQCKCVNAFLNTYKNDFCFYEGQSKSLLTLLISHLLNVFKFYFIFRKRCFHSLINANIKQRTAVVPEKIDIEYAWGSRSRSRQIWDWRHQTLSRNWPEIPYIFIKTDPRKLKTYICI